MSLQGRLANKVGMRFDGPHVIFDQPAFFNGGLIGGLGRGKVYYVDPANGSDDNNGKSPREALKTLLAGYNKLTANQHDVLVLIGGGTTATISDTLTWAKSYTHLIGIAAPTPNARARITVSDTDSAVAGLAITGSGCLFSNFRIFQGTSLANCGAISVSGDRNYFYNVDIQGMAGALAAASANAYSLLLDGAEECRFEKCTVGLDTVVRTDGAILRLDGSSARNEFVGCLFRSACETAAKPMVAFVDTSALDRSLLFDDCLFYNFWTNHGGKLDECFTIPASPATHDIILKNCSAVGITEWAKSDRGTIWVIGGTPAAGTAGSGSTGIAVEPS